MEFQVNNGIFEKQTMLEIEKQGLKQAQEAPIQFVYGFGPIDADVIMIGEAPGKDEVRLGRPFVGKAGAILDEILQKTGIKREQLYITNVVKYRLMRKGSREGSYKNRPATQAEIKMMLPWLKNEIETIKPKLILTLGNVPLRALCILQNCAILDIGSCHGTVRALQSDASQGHDRTIKHIPLYHPASQIYNRSLKDVFDGDFGNVRRFLQTQGE